MTKRDWWEALAIAGMLSTVVGLVLVVCGNSAGIVATGLGLLAIAATLQWARP